MLVGEEFTTKIGNVLRLECIDKSKGKPYMLYFSCNVCSKDKELWPEKSIKLKEYYLNNGTVPCGCSKRPSWTKSQYEIKLIRTLKGTGVEFIDWVDDYKNNKSKVLLKGLHGVISIGISDILSGKGFYNLGIRSSKEDTREDYIKVFMSTGAYPVGSEFWRDCTPVKGKSTHYWEYKCPICSKDEYTKAGVCTGVFKIAHHSLRVGYIPCRCARSYRKTEEQKNFQMETFAKKLGFKYEGFSEEYKGAKTKVTLVCKHGHEFIVASDHFLQSPRCTGCSKYGYDPSKSGSLYFAKFKNYNFECFKIGITNNSVVSRIKQCERAGSLSGEILKVFTHKDGKFVANLEKRLKSEIDMGYCPRELMGSGFTETFEVSEENSNYVYSFFKTLEIY